MINFIIYGNPIPKGRPRFFRKGNFMGTYTDKKTKKGEYDFKSQAVKYRPENPLTGALDIRIYVYVKIPKSFSRKKHNHAEIGIIRPTKRPDLDNYVKLVLDSMNGIFFIDDSQIVIMGCSKEYSIKPRIHIILKQLECEY